MVTCTHGLAACTGMRRGSLLALRSIDVDVKQRRIYLRTMKTGAIQVLPMSDAALQVLQSLPEGKSPDLVFSGVDAQLLSVTTRRVFAKIGVDDASFHTLRHTAASWMVQAGVDLYGVGQFLGHKTPRRTQRYAHLSPGYIAIAAGKLGTAMGKILPAKGIVPRPVRARLVPADSPEK
jgi:integrase